LGSYRLPHGYITSTILSDLTLHEFDQKVVEYVKGRGLSYTRYCDDMYVSGETGAWAAIKEIEGYLKESGLRMSCKKTKVMPRGKLHSVLSINVDSNSGWTPVQKKYIYSHYKDKTTKYLLDRAKGWKAFIDREGDVIRSLS
jgi:hypothetical protein